MDSIKQIVSEVITPEMAQSSEATNWWFYIALLELGAIVLLLALRGKKRRQTIEEIPFDIAKSKGGAVDMGAVMDNMHKAPELYKELKVVCHPDRFPNAPDLNAKADRLFQEISEYRRNYARLMELKERAQTELNIHFKS